MNAIIPSGPLPEILASSIALITLVTGVAFLTSILATRLGRCINRIRTDISKINSLETQSSELEILYRQLKILYKRTKLLRNTMTVAGVCILFVVLTIISAFSHAFFGFPATGVTVITFILALIWLVILVLGFIFDFISSLRAVEVEIECELEINKELRRSINADLESRMFLHSFLDTDKF